MARKTKGKTGGKRRAKPGGKPARKRAGKEAKAQPAAQPAAAPADRRRLEVWSRKLSEFEADVDGDEEKRRTLASRFQAFFGDAIQREPRLQWVVQIAARSASAADPVADAFAYAAAGYKYDLHGSIPEDRPGEHAEGCPVCGKPSSRGFYLAGLWDLFANVSPPDQDLLVCEQCWFLSNALYFRNRARMKGWFLPRLTRAVVTCRRPDTGDPCDGDCDTCPDGAGDGSEAPDPEVDVPAAAPAPADGVTACEASTPDAEPAETAGHRPSRKRSRCEVCGREVGRRNLWAWERGDNDPRWMCPTCAALANAEVHVSGPSGVADPPQIERWMEQEEVRADLEEHVAWMFPVAEKFLETVRALVKAGHRVVPKTLREEKGEPMTYGDLAEELAALHEHANKFPPGLGWAAPAGPRDEKPESCPDNAAQRAPAGPHESKADVPAAAQADRVEDEEEPAYGPPACSVAGPREKRPASEKAREEGVACTDGPYPAWAFDEEKAREKLLDHFGVQGEALDALGPQAKDLASSAAGALLRFMEETCRQEEKVLDVVEPASRAPTTTAARAGHRRRAAERTPRRPRTTPAGLSPAERKIFRCLSEKPQHTSELASRAKLAAAAVSAAVTVLELKGLARHVGKQTYVRGEAWTVTKG